MKRSYRLQTVPTVHISTCFEPLCFRGGGADPLLGRPPQCYLPHDGGASHLPDPALGSGGGGGGGGGSGFGGGGPVISSLSLQATRFACSRQQAQRLLALLGSSPSALAVAYGLACIRDLQLYRASRLPPSAIGKLIVAAPLAAIACRSNLQLELVFARMLRFPQATFELPVGPDACPLPPPAPGMGEFSTGLYRPCTSPSPRRSVQHCSPTTIYKYKIAKMKW